MRPLRIEMEGFSGFRSATTVSFDNAELVAFVGATGSGKSSIIDAIGFALYGSVPRYDDRRAVEPAIHKLAQEAKVRLDFELGDHNYTAVRVVRRTAKGATTKEARLVRTDADGTVTTLAGSERELSSQVEALLGLEFEQFTKTCVLPQGDFADFLHAGKSDRQELLRQLLDVAVYARMGQLARTRSELAATRALVLKEQLDEIKPMSEEDLAALSTRAGALERLVEELPGLVSALTAADTNVASIDTRRTAVEQIAARLAAIAIPRELPQLADRITAAQAEVDRTTDALTAARAERDAAKQALDRGPDRASLHRLVDGMTQLAVRTVELADLAPRVADAKTAAHAAAERARSAAAACEAAENELQAARDVAGLSAVIAGLVAGDPCPVCRQIIDTVPDHDVDAELDAATKTFQAARAKATDEASQHTRLAREADRLEERERNLAEACDALRATLPTDADLTDLQRQADVADQLAETYDAALGAVAIAETSEAAARAARAEFQQDETRMRNRLIETRETVADRRPPAPTGESLAGDWEQLVAWADAERGRVDEELTELRDQATQTTEIRRAAAAAIEAACASADITLANPLQAEVAAAAAKTEVDNMLALAEDRRTKVVQLNAEIATLTEHSEVHRMLGNLLKADGFERWLLQAALDRLVARATDRLHELSGGQFSLVADDGEFLVRDHANADELRSVRTLSGGETFLTSLALALALAEDIAEMATEGAPRIESMFLDEGFGTLDPDTLDVVAAAIEDLSAQGRLIGIVTHIRDLAERMPVRFEVSKDATTSRVERVEA